MIFKRQSKLMQKRKRNIVRTYRSGNEKGR